MKIASHHRIYACFFLFAATLGALQARLPDLQRALELDEAELGLTLTGAAVGALFALTFGSSIVSKLGPRKTAFLTIFGIPAVLVFVPWLPSAPAVFGCLLIQGILAGLLEINLNVEIDRIEAQMGRGVMNRAHGFWSIGFFVTALLSSPIRQAGVSMHLHLAATLVIAWIVGWIFINKMQTAPPRIPNNDDIGPLIAIPTLGLLPLCAIGIAALLSEGGGIDWSAIYMRDVFEVEPFVGGLGLTAFALSMAIGRLTADGLGDRFGARTVAGTLLILAAAGLALVWLAPLYEIAIVGFAMIGGGCSAVYPLAISAAAQRTDRPAHVNVAALGQVSFVVFFIGPPLLGFIAHAYGIRNAFLVCLPIVCVALFCIRSLPGKRGARPADATSSAHAEI
ncbi:major facilitator superfamily MFS_1 (plasmid) [Rhizobium leguminosarum bv. trifolii WSM2304]|uniref:Major facilitator superfamily MFS_1 n=1 Tax=Rhizobium leguminosarum bv. trifolii (strain WSM2304) TaxID=395492 RepID=A0ABF7QZN7_RHILW|nr:MFS transporter [Rhizobium leguminosarum]ACI59642.1 major facilitator superfamily MFS_1 [Rhizobium leguminosarum bv. trifolii WSM2304]